MFHTLAHFSPVASTDFVDVVAIADEVFGEKNNHFLYGADLNLIAGFVLSSSTNLRQLQVLTPLLRSTGTPNLRPWNVGSATPTDPNLGLMLQRAPLLKQQEEIFVQARGTTAASTDIFALLWVTPGLQPAPPQGNIITLQAESTTAVAAGVWASLSDISSSEGWLESLPKGRYAVVGSECVSATGVAHRWIFDNQIFRPGALSSPSIGSRTHRIFYDGVLGTWGTFISQVPPRVEVLCNAADSAHTVFLQVVRIGD